MSARQSELRKSLWADPGHRAKQAAARVRGPDPRWKYKAVVVRHDPGRIAAGWRLIPPQRRPHSEHPTLCSVVDRSGEIMLWVSRRKAPEIVRMLKRIAGDACGN